jgi:hypothetical protein
MLRKCSLEIGKLSISRESSVLEKEFRGASEESTLDNATNECNMYVVSGKGRDSEINMYPSHLDSAQEIPEEEEVGRNDVTNVPTEEQAVLSKERKTKAMSYKRQQQGEIMNDHILQSMPHRETAVRSKSG